ncbi:MAG: hypothetical protein PF489_15780, partial [Salinivirgaceae bacterium]|nr:hypothetical protein [Salinivirgaceae bacterium]
MSMKRMNYYCFASFLFLFLIIMISPATGQNTIITDSELQNAHQSALLDLYSESKGLLVPRLTQVEMENINVPAAGLLVYNKTRNNFFFYTGTEWLAVGVTGYFLENAGNLHTREDTVHFGIGTTTPLSKLTVQGDQPTGNNEALFEVKNSLGETIFAVYENEVRVNFKESSGKASKGGFAVGGITPNKANPVDYFRISPDSVQIFIDDLGLKGAKGGFAVGGITPNKSGITQYLTISPDSARVYVNDPPVGGKAAKGGFAVGGITPNKGISNTYLTIERDSTRIYVDNSAKASKGGFAVGGITPNKGEVATFLDLTPDNYFIGHNSGLFTTGINNSFFGFEAGYNNLSGSNNVFIGQKSGYSNTGGYNNLFIGNESGYNNISGYGNTFIGLKSGHLNDSGRYNLCLGPYAGESNIGGVENVYLGFYAGKNSNASGNVMVGSWAGYNNTTGDFNTFLGKHSGTSSTGTNNTFVGYGSGGNGSNNVAIGSMAGILVKGNYNVFMGQQVARYDTVGSSNIIIGYRAGFNAKYANNNVIIGTRSNYLGDSLVGNVFIGYAAGYNETGSNKLYIDNSTTTLPLIYGDFTANDLVFNGDVQITGTLTGGKSVKYTTNVFENTYQLKPLGNYMAEVRTMKHLPALQSIEDINQNGYNYSQQLEGLVEELQKAYLYIEELN